MKNRYRQVRPRFARIARFEIDPIPPVPFRGAAEGELDALKARLLKQLLDQAEAPELYAPLRRAANEAASLAWFTPFPLLVFPGLLEEKARDVVRQARHQREIRRRTSRLFERAITE